VIPRPISFVTDPKLQPIELFAAGKIDAFLALRQTTGLACA
jgi:hypothetical protein